MNKTDLVLMALAKCELAEDDQERKKAREELRMAIRGYEQVRRDPEVITMDLLAEIGAPDHLVGYNYVLRAVQMLLEDRESGNHAMKLYARLGEEFCVAAGTAEGRIRHFVEYAWEHGSMDAQSKYFGNTIHPDRGSPTNLQFLARLANIVRMEMRK